MLFDLSRAGLGRVMPNFRDRSELHDGRAPGAPVVLGAFLLGTALLVMAYLAAFSIVGSILFIAGLIFLMSAAVLLLQRRGCDWRRAIVAVLALTVAFLIVLPLLQEFVGNFFGE